MSTSSIADNVELTRRIGVTDLHSDLPLALLHRRFSGVEGSLRDEWLPHLRAGGLDTIVCAVYIDDLFLPEGALRRAVQLVDALREEVALCPEAFALATTAEQIEAIRAEGKIALLLAFEGAEPFGNDLAGLRLFHALGMRMLSFAWMRRTAYADGAWENDSGGGLTRLGKQAVAEMNRLGIIPDVSHLSDRSTWDVLEASSGPVIASHSNARALRDHPRNLTDEMIQAIATSGGLVGAVAVANYIAEPEATVAAWVDHIDHMVNLVGIEHVGLGFDFYDEIETMGASHGISAWGPLVGLGQLAVPGMSAWPDVVNLTGELRQRGYLEEGMAKIYGGNFCRVLAAISGK